MLRRIRFALLIASLLLCGFTNPAHAATTTNTKNSGLYLSPLRSYLTLKPGETVTRAFTVANQTAKPMRITTDIDQFSMVDYSYDYRFNEVDNDWVRLVESSVTLQPSEVHQLAYTVSIPKTASPGGHYYTLYAATPITNGDNTTSTIRAASLLYLTVEGDLTRTMTIVQQSLPRFVTSSTIPYSFDIKNTGNIHYFTVVSARLDGLFYSYAPNGASQLLMPGTTRTINASIAAPILPGIYKFTYTLSRENQGPIEGSRYIVNMPLWFIVLSILVIIAIVRYRQWHQAKK